MANDKLLAEWFWTDRWMGSSAFGLPMEPRGLYREMLTQAWRRKARLPNHHETIRRFVGCTVDEWDRCWPQIESYWRVTPDNFLVNDTQVEIYTKTANLSEVRSVAGKLGASSRWDSKPDSKIVSKDEANGMAKPCPPSPSPSPSPDLSQSPKKGSDPNNKLVTGDKASTTAELALSKPNGNGHKRPVDSRSKRPIFTGQRLTVFEWFLSKAEQVLGEKHYMAFDIHEWFFTLDAHAAKADIVIPQRDNGAWLEQQLIAEAGRRGLPIAVLAQPPSKRALRDAAALQLMRNIS